MSTINFNDKIFAQEALQAFVADLSPLAFFSHSYNAQSAQKGDAIYIPRVDAITTTTFSYTDNSGFPYENSGGTIGTITVTMDQQFINAIDITDLQVMNSSAAEWGNFARQQGKSLAKAVWQRIASIFTTANFGTAVQNISIANYGYTAGASIRTVMAKRDVLKEVGTDRLALIVNQDVNYSFLSNSTVYQNYIFNGDVARVGKVGQVAGMDVYPINIMPTGGISLVGVVAHPDGVAVACRYLEPQEPGAYISAQRLVDDESGIVMGYRRHYNPGRGKMFVNFEALFGFGVGLSLGIGLLARSD